MRKIFLIIIVLINCAYLSAFAESTKDDDEQVVEEAQADEVKSDKPVKLDKKLSSRKKPKNGDEKIDHTSLRPGQKEPMLGLDKN